MNKMFSITAVIAGCLILQACSFSGEKNIDQNISQQAEASVAEFGVTNEVGQLDVGDSLLSNTSNDSEAREYSVVESYMAASGRECREVDIRKLSGGQEVKTSVLCQKKTGNWYWPRDVIFK